MKRRKKKQSPGPGKSTKKKEKNIEIIGEASNGEEALEVQKLQPHLLIIDIRMPVMNGLEATRKLKEVSITTKALILSMHNDEDYILQSIESGASGYLLKDTSKEEFLKAIHLKKLKVNNVVELLKKIEEEPGLKEYIQAG